MSGAEDLKPELERLKQANEQLRNQRDCRGDHSG
jgi:hypothetical protein